MAVNIAGSITYDSAVDASSYVAGTFTASAGAYVWFFVAIPGSPSSCTITLSPYIPVSQVALVTFNSNYTLRLFRSTARLAATLYTVTVNLSSVVLGISLAGYQVLSAANSNNYRQYNVGSGSSLNPTVTMTSLPAINDALLGAVAMNRQVPALTMPTGWSAEYRDTGIATPVMGLETAHDWSTDGVSQTIVWTGATSNWGAIVFELYYRSVGTLVKTLDDVSLSSTGEVPLSEVSGALDVLLEDLYISSEGEVVTNSGTLDVILDSMSVLSSGMVFKACEITLRERSAGLSVIPRILFFSIKGRS